jgi:hypothetical protein
MENLSEEIVQSISAVYDSVGLIKQLEILEEPTQLEVDSILRNKKHITIMLEKEWFSSSLTPEQLAELIENKI